MGYPNTRFRYKVEIDGLDAGGFSEVTGFDASIDVVEYREGDMVTTPMKVPGLKRYGLKERPSQLPFLTKKNPPRLHGRSSMLGL